MSRISRRRFLKVAGFSALALATGCKIADQSSNNVSATRVPSAVATRASTPLPAAPAEIQITPASEFYRQSYGSKPEVDLSSWRLTVDGLVENPVTLSLDDIKAMEPVEATRTLECIGNPVGGPLIGTAVWRGVYLKTLLEAVKVKPSAIRAKFKAADDYSTAVDLKWILQPDTLLICEMNGEPLNRDHGFPLRILMPGLYGQKNPKWLKQIEFIDTEYQGYWERNGWSDVAEVKTNSIIQQPPALASLPAGSVPVFGVAFAGNRKITQVEVQVDDAEWLPAKLVQADSSLVWTQWSFDWPAAAGRHSLAVRATDETGYTQSEVGVAVLGDSYPAGTAKVHSIIVTVKSG